MKALSRVTQEMFDKANEQDRSSVNLLQLIASAPIATLVVEAATYS